MYYYHGSKSLFNEFDLTKSGGSLCLTPHLEYAKKFGPYVYTVEVGAYQTQVYHEGMSNVTFRSLVDVKIVQVTDLRFEALQKWGSYFALHCETPTEWEQVTHILQWSWNYGSWENNQESTVILVQAVQTKIRVNTCHIGWIEPPVQHIYPALEFIRDWQLDQLISK